MNPISFIIDIIINVFIRIDQEFTELPGKVYDAFKAAIGNVSWLDLIIAAGPVGFNGILVKIATVPLDEFQNFIQRLQRIPTRAVAEEAKKLIRPNLPKRLQNRVMKLSDVVLFCADVIAEAAISSAQLNIPGTFAFWIRVKSIISKINLLLNGLPIAGLFKKLASKLWFIIIDMVILFWNYGLMFWSVLTLISLFSKAIGHAMDNYALKQTNKQVQDDVLGRKRVRK